MNAIFTRRSVRRYKDQEVEQEKIEQILRAAMQAPSAANQQPWEFIVVKDRQKLDALARVSPYASSILSAPVSIILLGNDERMRYGAYWEQDLGAATQNLMIEAVELDLGSVWLGIWPDEERIDFVRDMFQLGQHIRPYAIVSVGYPADGQENKFVDRYEPERIHYETY